MIYVIEQTMINQPNWGKVAEVELVYKTNASCNYNK